jgi:hypothetical protein
VNAQPTAARARPAGRAFEGGAAAAAGWVLLAALLLATLVAAATFDRRRWPGLVGDEATYLMQAQSLAWDLDLAYTRLDYDRFVAQWNRPPEGLILQSTDGGRTLTYGKPALYPAYLAPFVRLAPRRGPLVANALLLAAAGLAAARGLRPALGAGAPWFAAAFLFGSASFAYVFWIHADLALMAAAALGLALAFGGRAGAGAETGAGAEAAAGCRAALRGAAAGALLAAPALARPFYATLLAAAAIATAAAPAAHGRRRRSLLALAAGAAVVAAGAVAVNLAVRGVWTPYGGERLGFYSSTGFPAVDLPAGGWRDEIARRGGTGSWVAPAKLRYPVAPRLWAWDLFYFVAGRDVGVLPYFLPLALGFAAWRPRSRRWPLVVAAAATVACFIVVRPFNFYGGGGALANRYFLPLYPAFWFLAARRLRPAWAAGLAVAAAALAAPFLWPLWTAPRAFPLHVEGELRYVSAAARRWLPYETTLDHLKPTGGDDLAVGGLWIKPLANPLRAGDDGWLAAARPAPVEILVGSPRPLAALRLDQPPGAPAGLAVAGADLESPTPLPGGLTTQVLRHPDLAARHRMWWTADDVHLYRLRLTFPGPSPPTFRLAPVP